jgi:phosphatidylserine decarboxylase
MKPIENQDSFLSLDNASPIQMGFWVPNRIWATANYLIPLRDFVAQKKKDGTLTPMGEVMSNFKYWVTTHGIYRMYMTQMIDQANAYLEGLDEETKHKIKGDGDFTGIYTYELLFDCLNEIITTSPAFNTSAQVGTPMNGLLAVAMATEAGLTLFHDATFNAQFKTILDAWNTFLKSPASLDKLDITKPDKLGSWISPRAHDAGVWKDLQHNAKLPGYGFTNWNAFFIRKFVEGARPFDGGSDVINIGCETTPWVYANNIALDSKYWIKTVNYSLVDLFGGNVDWARFFENGQLYQGFLSATHYHCWNAPLDGELVRSWVQPGTYFAQRPGQGENQGTWEGTASEPYLGHVAARAIFIFKHRLCGYVALICIGMVEVSTCYINEDFIVGENDPSIHIKKGTEIGNFEFGGSTHMMIFQKDKVKLEKWALDACTHTAPGHPDKPKPATHLGTVIARPA